MNGSILKFAAAFSVTLICSKELCVGATETAMPSRMYGMSEEQVQRCMGKPNRRVAWGEAELWSYVSSTNSLTSQDCTINLTFHNGHVTEVRINGLVTSHEECAQATANCSK